MVVGHDQTARIDDDARTQRVLNLLARPSEIAAFTKELAEKRIVEQSLRGILCRKGL